MNRLHPAKNAHRRVHELGHHLVHRRCREQIPRHEATDQPIEARPEELAVIRSQLEAIEEMLAQLFGAAYGRGELGMAARATAATIVEEDFDAIVEEWCVSMERAFGDGELHREGMANAMARFVGHLRDPDDLRTYIHLRRHCQQGMLAEAKPSEFNIFHIALKQVILKRVHAQ